MIEFSPQKNEFIINPTVLWRKYKDAPEAAKFSDKNLIKNKMNIKYDRIPLRKK